MDDYYDELMGTIPVLNVGDISNIEDIEHNTEDIGNVNEMENLETLEDIGYSEGTEVDVDNYIPFVYTPDYVYDTDIDSIEIPNDRVDSVLEYVSDFDFVEDAKIVSYNPYGGSMEIKLTIMDSYPGDVWEYGDYIFQSLWEYAYVSALNHSGSNYHVYGIVYKLPRTKFITAASAV